jgi:hypothetical protein
VAELVNSLNGTVNLIGSGGDKAHSEVGRTVGYARAATPMTSAQVWMDVIPPADLPAQLISKPLAANLTGLAA